MVSRQPSSAGSMGAQVEYVAGFGFAVYLASAELPAHRQAARPPCCPPPSPPIPNPVLPQPRKTLTISLWDPHSSTGLWDQCNVSETHMRRTLLGHVEYFTASPVCMCIGARGGEGGGGKCLQSRYASLHILIRRGSHVLGLHTVTVVHAGRLTPFPSSRPSCPHHTDRPLAASEPFAPKPFPVFGSQ